MDGGAVFSSDTVLNADGVSSKRPKLDRAQRGFSPEYRLYETNDNWIQVCALTDDHWNRLCETLGVESNGDRARAESQLEQAFMSKTAVTWSHVLDDAGVPNEVAVDVKGGETMLFDADNERLGLVEEYEHAILGKLRQFGHTVHFSDTPGEIFGPPPRVGEHSREILTELGVSAKEQDELKQAGVVYWPDDNYVWGW